MSKEPTPLKAAIAQIESTYQSIDDLTASFTQQTHIALVDRTVTKQGTFQFKKGGMLRIAYQGSGEKHYISDGTTLWIFIPGDEESLQTFAVNDKTVPKEALSFLHGFGKLTKEFEVTGSNAFPKNSKGDALHLTPKEKDPQYASLDALFGASHLLDELIVNNLSGNQSHYSFTNTKTNQNLPESLFTLSSGKATPDTLPLQ